MIMERNFAPVIIFSFSRKECEAYGMQMSKLDFNTGMLSWNVHFFTFIYQRLILLISLWLNSML